MQPNEEVALLACVEVACRAWNPAWSNFEEPAAAFATIAFNGGAVVSYREEDYQHEHTH